jgi:hypothetical protein
VVDHDIGNDLDAVVMADLDKLAQLSLTAIFTVQLI